MEIIKGWCRTNLDTYAREEWPKAFAFPPRVGDSVQAKSGRKLRVAHVTHALDVDGRPCVEVELHH